MIDFMKTIQFRLLEEGLDIIMFDEEVIKIRTEKELNDIFDGMHALFTEVLEDDKNISKLKELFKVYFMATPFERREQKEAFYKKAEKLGFVATDD